MKKTDSAGSLLLFTVLCAIAGAFLRAAFLNGGRAVYLIAASVIVAVIIICGCVRLKTVSHCSDLFQKSLLCAITQFFGALFLITGGFLCLLQETDVMQTILAVLAIVSAVSVVLATQHTQTGKKQKTLYNVILSLFYVIKLFYDFRNWMHDPAVLDYCFRLFAAISFMLCAYHLAEATVTDAKRQRLAIFSLCGVFFGAVSMSDLSGSDFLYCAGSVLWALGTARQVTDYKTDYQGDEKL